jgi:hypothetical protein
MGNKASSFWGCGQVLWCSISSRSVVMITVPWVCHAVFIGIKRIYHGKCDDDFRLELIIWGASSHLVILQWISVYYLQVLQDAVLENQTEAAFVTSAGPKAVATCHLHQLSRQMCPHLRHFVVFSSLVCGHGNAGQSNYGMSNSICEARVRDGFPGLAIQWGMWGWWQRCRRNIPTQ